MPAVCSVEMAVREPANGRDESKGVACCLSIGSGETYTGDERLLLVGADVEPAIGRKRNGGGARQLLFDDCVPDSPEWFPEAETRITVPALGRVKSGSNASRNPLFHARISPAWGPWQISFFASKGHSRRVRRLVEDPGTEHVSARRQGSVFCRCEGEYRM
jgi:hypothetical protein